MAGEGGEGGTGLLSWPRRWQQVGEQRRQRQWWQAGGSGNSTGRRATAAAAARVIAAAAACTSRQASAALRRAHPGCAAAAISCFAMAGGRNQVRLPWTAADWFTALNCAIAKRSRPRERGPSRGAVRRDSRWSLRSPGSLRSARANCLKFQESRGTPTCPETWACRR